MPIRPKKALLDQVADAISRARWAEKDLQDLDQRAWKMQGNSKTWAKNAGKFNDRAAALEAKMNYNNWLSNKLRGDAQENVNQANKDWNDRLRSMLNDQETYINLDELAYTGGTPASKSSNFTSRARDVGKKSGVEHADGMSAEDIADEMYEYGLYPVDAQDIDRFNISNSESLDDLVPEEPYYNLPEENGYDGWARARNAIGRFYNDNSKGNYWRALDNFRNEQRKTEEAMRAYQNGGKRYRQ